MGLEEGHILAQVIRTWLPTVCYELVLPIMPVRIDYRVVQNNLGTVLGGQYWNGAITMYAVPGPAGVDPQRHYLRLLAHECRHAWQFLYHVAPTEADCDAFADLLLQRRPSPIMDPYTGPLEGEPWRCRCGKLTITAPYCLACWEAEARLSAPTKSYAAPSPPKPPLMQRIRTAFVAMRDSRQRRRTEAAVAYSRHIDNHPDNGKLGWWRVAGRFYVQASTAGEAIIKVSGMLETTAPSVEFVGEDCPV